MNVLNLLVGLNSVILVFLVVNVFKPFFGSYAAKKGENLATKEDIAQLTKIAEGIKAKISDEVWDRQRQWELRRDAVFDSVHALTDLDDAILSFSRKEINDADENFFRCNSTFLRSQMMTDLVVGGKLSKELSEYHNCIQDIIKKKCMDREIQIKIKNSENGVIFAARDALGIKDAGDFPV